MAGILKVDTISTGDGSYSVDVASLKQAYANFYYAVNDAAGTLTIASTATYGQHMLFTHAGPYLNVTPDPSTSTWTHAYTGVYKAEISFRQASGGDVWTVLAITKNGQVDAVGISVRTGSTNNFFDQREIVYTVDSTTATYQVQHWVQATGKTTTSDFAGKPGWTNYDTLTGSTTGDTGRMVDYVIYRLGDLNV
jgi:hypothetical protein